MSWNLRRKLIAAALWLIAAVPWIWAGSMYARTLLLEDDIDVLRVQIERLRAEAASAYEIAHHVSPEQQRIELTKWELPTGADIAGTMHALESMAASSGVQIRAIRTPASDEVGSQFFDVAGDGSPAEICSWLSALERDERLLIVQSGSIGRSELGAVGFDVRLARFHSERAR